MLDREELVAGLPALVLDNSENAAKEFLGLSRDVMHKMTAMECGEACSILQDFALHLQRLINRLDAKVYWANESINRAIAGEVAKAPGFAYDERRLNCIYANDAAKVYHNIVVNANLRIQRFKYLSQRIDAKARTFASMQQQNRRLGNNDD